MTRGTVLVTGGAGYVGAHACKALHAAGYSPVVLDNLSTGHRNFVRWGPLIESDIRDGGRLREAFGLYRPTAVLHFAASAYVGESVSDPRQYYENNVAGTLSLLAAMLDAGCQKLVFSSTCAIYGAPAELPIRESMPQNPVNPYGASKAMVERILRDYGLAFGLASIALRYFNAAGADQDVEIGELRDPETHLIPRAMMSLQGHISDFTIHGSNYPTADGTAIRDYIHVSDLADAHVLALERLLAEESGGAFNLGTGKGYSVKQLLDAIAAETGQTLQAPSGMPREGDPPELIADPTLGRVELGFTPKYSDLGTIIRSAWAWHRRAHPKKNLPSEADLVVTGHPL